MAPTTASVLLHGESGTGKELFARFLHDHSRRAGAFVPVNCAALPEAILESVIFGHRRGAFTGATEASSGLVVAADGGTLFLDEVGELPASVQAKLLRVLQKRTVLAVGEHRERRVDLRVVAASHRDLRQLVAEGRFRDDLYHRLARFEIHLPPLRERGRDVIVIARAMLNAGMDGVAPRRLSRSAEPVLLAHGWPGNVRELGNVLFRAAQNARARSVIGGDLAEALDVLKPLAPLPPTQRLLRLVLTSGNASSGERVDALGVARVPVKGVVSALIDARALVAEDAATRPRTLGGGPKTLVRRSWGDRSLRLAKTQGPVTRDLLVDAADIAPPDRFSRAR